MRQRRYSPPGVFGISLATNLCAYRFICTGRFRGQIKKVAQFVGKFDELTGTGRGRSVLAIETIDTPRPAEYKPVARPG